MKDKTIIVLKDIVGEYDDSQEFIVGVYIIDKPDFDLHREFNKYLKELYESWGFKVHMMGDKDNQYVALEYLLYEYRKEYKGRFRELNKKHTQLLKANKKIHNIIYYVEEILKLQKVEVREVYIN